MLSRIMRHPSGLVKKALGGRFLRAVWEQRNASAGPPVQPAYWTHRYSGLGLLLAAPAPSAPAASPAGGAPVAVPPFGNASLPAHDGKAASYLSAAKVPAARA